MRGPSPDGHQMPEGVRSRISAETVCGLEDGISHRRKTSVSISARTRRDGAPFQKRLCPSQQGEGRALHIAVRPKIAQTTYPSLDITQLMQYNGSQRGGKGLKRRDLIKELEDGGFRLLRDDGDHTIYTRPGYRRIEVPKHREINEYTARTILKQAGLK